MELEQIVIPRLQMPQSSGPLYIDDGGKLILKLIIGVIVVGVLVFVLSKLGIFRREIFVKRQVKGH